MVKRLVTIWLLVGVFTLFADAQRQNVYLNGLWEFVRVKSLDEPPPVQGWQPIQVPGTIYGYNYERAWFRRKFFVPEGWRRHRLILHFGGVKYNSRIFVNGKHVGGCFNGYDAFEIDITDAARFGSENELLVGVHDWTGVFVGAPVDFEKDLRPDLRETPQDRVIAPIGGRFADYGIWDSVTLKVVLKVYFAEVFIRPLVRQNRLEVDVWIVNTTSESFNANLVAKVYRWNGKERDENGQWQVNGSPIAAFPSVKIQVAANERKRFTIGFPNPPLEFWFPHQPRLYVLELRFDAPNSDVFCERFGWREFWCKNGDFYLNGKKVHLLATSWWPPIQGVTREFVKSQLLGIKAMNAFAFRTHTQPWQRIWYEVADEVGVMMIPEGAVWNDDTVYRVKDPKFWENYAAHLRAMVRNLFNHPSIVMWSLENEFYGSRANDDTPEVEANLAKMGLIVKSEDPTRPITYESDGDPGGVTDVIGIHYPNEFPDRRLWPNNAFWMEEPRFITGGGGMFWDKKPFLWDRKKPLYIGEFLWVPSKDPSTQTLFFGDEAYKDHRRYWLKAKAIAWRMQILAYRHYGVSGISPWTVVEGGSLDETNPLWVAQRDMYRPLSAFVREYDRRFFAGEKIRRTVEIFNDTMTELKKVLFSWQLVDGGKVIAEGKETLRLDSGEHIERNLTIQMPKFQTKRSLTLRLTLNAPNSTAFREDYPIEVFLRISLSLPKVRLALYDPKGQFAHIAKRFGRKIVKLNSIREWDGKAILVIAPRALESKKAKEPIIGAADEEFGWLAEKVQKGGRVLILEQTDVASDWLPVSLTHQSSTMAFPHFAHHPILKGLSSDDFRWWRGDHIVSSYEPVRPNQAGMLPLVVTGSSMGVSHAPLIEVRQGNGVWLICQLKVVSKFETEPVARILLQRMLNYLASYRPPQTEILCFGSPNLHEQLERLRVEWKPLSDWSEIRNSKDSEIRNSKDKVLVLQSGKDVDANISLLRSFLQNGGTVVWHRPKFVEFEKVKAALNLPVIMQPYRGAATRIEGQGELLNSLFREDLYWLGPASGLDWEPTPLAMEMAEAVFAPEVKLADAVKFEAEKGVETEKQGMSVLETEVLFWANSRAHWRINFPVTGRYHFAMMARGTSVDGIYPFAEIYLDGEKVGVMSVSSEKYQLFSCSFFAKAGTRRLTIAFVNDAYRPPEDRNLWVDYFLLAPVKRETDVESLTSPLSCWER
ncbi:MAG: hypothetical protein NZ805_15145 [Armatimonadetes bacterium]|nr:hypothetical protein [Armatimonadota bacterium]MDW8028515.1 glycoside hydrolase family 2 TIM barrel-domain containing protein [Armatimonadota bacterium]